MGPFGRPLVIFAATLVLADFGFCAVSNDVGDGGRSSLSR